MQEQLDLLKEMGTWETVQKPPDAVPIANKWVFVKKRNKQWEVVRYKARLVAKGCAQRLGFHYMERFSPVVRMDTLRAILALVAEKGLKMQQIRLGASGTMNLMINSRSTIISTYFPIHVPIFDGLMMTSEF
jgi:Reverse transcriptase (RNA-dependent DNA polymerase)